MGPCQDRDALNKLQGAGTLFGCHASQLEEWARMDKNGGRLDVNIDSLYKHIAIIRMQNICANQHKHNSRCEVVPEQVFVCLM